MVHGYITILKKNGADGQQIPVKQSVKIGRSSHCDVRILVQSVSEQHCLVLVEDGQRALIQNLSSTSQTLVNNVSIGKERHPLQHGDIVSVGERSFRWQYAESNPFYESKRIHQKRRKSEADSALGSHNVAVVNPLYHKRRTLGPNITYSEPSTRSLKVAVLKTLDTKQGSTDKTVEVVALSSIVKTPSRRTSAASRTPKAETPKSKTPKVETPKGKTPKVETPKGKTPKVETPKGKTPKVETPKGKTSKAETPKSKTPKAETPKAKTPKAETPKAKTPKAETPKAESLKAKTPKAETPKAKTPKAETPKAKTPKAETPKPKTPKAETPKPKTPKAETPKPKTPKAETPKPKTPKAATPKAKTPMARKSAAKSAKQSESKRKSVKTTKGSKRRLSSPSSVAAKRMKIESPKSIDKKKMTALMGIHGKSPRVAPSSTPIVRLILSAKKTPIIKTTKTPRSSTVKKSGVKSSIKKAHKPTFAEILKKKAVQRANAVVKKLALAPNPRPKVAPKKVEKVPLSTEIPQNFKFGSTGHANSPETIFIGRKATKTPVATKKGRKVPLIQQTLRGGINLSGISEMFQTPLKDVSVKSTSSSSGFPPNTSALLASSPSPVKSASIHKSLRNSRSVVSTPTNKPSPVKTPKTGQLTESREKRSAARTSVKSTSPSKTPLANSVNTSGRSSTRSTSFLEEEKIPARTPRSVSKSVLQSGSKKHCALLTSTPAVFGRSQSFAESAFDSPSSLLTGQISAPQSPASGRKSRLDMVAPRSSYVHSPLASPVKSSLKNSPSKSPPSAGHSKNLSVSFNDSIHIKMLVSNSKKTVDTTASLSSPASSHGSEGHGGVATPDLTTFDFNSIKTPNVPREMFVSSILSSAGSSSSSPTAGSAKRKGKAPKSPTNDLSDLRGVRRLMQTPSSPAGYVDVKGIKRLMATCPTPTYLAVEGVKKLFNDAAAAAGNDPASFAGVRELFGSPSLSKVKRFSLKSSLCESLQTTPVAKIQAEVESKGRSSTGSSSKTSKLTQSPVNVTPTLTVSSIDKSQDGKKLKASDAKVTRNKLKESVSEKETTPKRTSSKNEAREPRTSTQAVAAETVKPTRKTRKAAPSPQIVKSNSPVVESPPKRQTRRTAKASTPLKKSPEHNLPKTRTRRGVKTASPVTTKNSRNSSESVREASHSSTVDEEIGTSVTAPKSSPAKAVSKRVKSKQAVAKSPVIGSPPKKRTTRRGAKAGESSSVEKPLKRALSPSKDESDSPVKKLKKDVTKSPASEKSPPKRATRRAKKNATPIKETSEPLSATPSKRKRKIVSFEDDVVTPSKKGKTEALEEVASPHVVSPNNEKTKKAPSKKQTKAKSVKSAKTTKKATPAVTVSPRRTRSRK
ncbi:hypothetical protein FOCC_FOCC016362 [Frankliniella occidentalis]|uniref:Proteoglycan 4 n=1 Tax=Frankliniella occidentalis TaxID=133901 RepID=A0A6J1TNX9_FRAOC|nr:proteoglycan 4 [Frankliniella occidentalis]XP_026294519.1 proteoglycan 4 [Frankliniella occidentalis]KAE8738164.1 hypothetical protein FOCC_FOCC016362 [Frankliniella occidentalis]